jgi:hypothetical protein
VRRHQLEIRVNPVNPDAHVFLLAAEAVDLREFLWIGVPVLEIVAENSNPTLRQKIALVGFGKSKKKEGMGQEGKKRRDEKKKKKKKKSKKKRKGEKNRKPQKHAETSKEKEIENQRRQRRTLSWCLPTPFNFALSSSLSASSARFSPSSLRMSAVLASLSSWRP